MFDRFQVHPVAVDTATEQRRVTSTATQEAAMMDSRTGLDYIVENKDYVAKLGTALDSDNHTVKKQVFDLLSALCAYSPEGYNRAFETLDHYMVSRVLLLLLLLLTTPTTASEASLTLHSPIPFTRLVIYLLTCPHHSTHDRHHHHLSTHTRSNWLY